MAWGYEAHFTVEHDNTLKRKIDCKDCVYYDRSDKSCMKTPRYLPEDGYNSWRQCGYFELDSSTSHYDEKLQQFKEWSNKMARKEAANHKKVFLNQSKNRIEHPAVSKASIEKAKQKTVNAENRISDKECKVLVLKEYETH